MPTLLKHAKAKLTQRTNVLDNAFDRHLIDPKVTRRVDRFALQEGLLSALWQSWCAFCRTTVMESTLGALTTTGIVTSSGYSANTEGEIAFLAKQFSQGNTTTRVRAVRGSYEEPNWGSTKVLNHAVNGLAPSNMTTLATAFGAVQVLEDLQLCRNASAHVRGDLILHLKAARVRYDKTGFDHPSDAMFWIDPISRDYLWKSWLDEIDLISTFAIQ